MNVNQIAEAFDRTRFLVRNRKATQAEHEKSEGDLTVIANALAAFCTPPPAQKPPEAPAKGKPEKAAAEVAPSGR